MAVKRVSGDRIARSLHQLGVRIRALRLERGLRLADMATLTGFSEAYLYRVEEGQRSPSLPGLLRIADAFNVSPGELLDAPVSNTRLAVHHGAAVWEGTERDGDGQMWSATSSARRYDLASRLRTSEDEQATSPEEHIGMALAGCFSMSLAQQLEAAGFAPRRIETGADVKLSIGADGVELSSIVLNAHADVPGISPARLEDLAQYTKKACVIARALAAVPVTLTLVADDEPEQ
jgi:lipoyl-dependent peroxiredoxin